MTWNDLRDAFPSDAAADLRDRIAETLQSYGMEPVTQDAGSATLGLASGERLTWTFGAASVQRVSPDARLAQRLPEALRDAGPLEIRRPADLVLIVALFEDPMKAALRRKLAIVRDKFPGWTGFGSGDAAFDNEERTYKVEAGRALLRRLAHATGDHDVLEAVAEAARATNLLDWRLKDLFSPPSNQEAHGHAYAALLDSRDRPEEHPAALARFVTDWLALTPEARPDTARQIAEYLLFLCNPSEACFFKARRLGDTYLQTYALRFPDLAPDAAYVEELRLARTWQNALTEAGFPPRDLMDVQSFLFVAADDSAAPLPAAPLPIDTAPTQKIETPMPPLNTILYGPPGTGKTFETFRAAVAICDGEEAVAAMNADALRARYETLRAEGRIGFVTFHQSYSYEDFVEGLRPEGGDGEAGFHLAPRPGVLREIAALAESDSTPINQATASGEGPAFSTGGKSFFKMSIGEAAVAADEYLFEEAIANGYALLGWEDIDYSDARFDDVNEILRACQEQGKREGEVKLASGQVDMANTFRNKMKVGDIIVVSKGNKLIRAVGEVTGGYEYHPRDTGVYTHRRAVRWLWVYRPGIPVDTIYDGRLNRWSTYRLATDRVDASAVERLVNGGNIPPSEALPHVLVMDEINRANVSKVFGEIITLLEDDKRAGAENAISVRLPYSGEDFTLPANLHFLGTMNTADRSIALLDTALRRRFEFIEMPPRPGLLEHVDGLDLPELLGRLNQRIEYLADRDHLIGHAFFMRCQTRADVDNVMRRKVLPLLAEYFHEDWARIVAVLGGPLQGFIACEALPVPPGLDLGGDETRWRYTVRDSFAEGAYAGLQP
ncbi:AAA family ATPase [Sagittula sp.]|uniref:AAA family ATPase n=1 Tax=Sagittula sp. TaxID=2038081 RepID=UPI0035189757